MKSRAADYPLVVLIARTISGYPIHRDWGKVGETMRTRYEDLAREAIAAVREHDKERAP